MAKPKKGVVPAHLKKYLFKSKKKKTGGAASRTGSTKKRTSAGVSTMAKTKKKGGGGRRRSRSKHAGVIAVIGGAAAATALRPMIERYLPDNLKTAGNIAGPAVVGALGYFGLRKFNKQAALGWLAATIGITVGGMAGAALNRSSGVNGFGSPDGIDYLQGMSDDEIAGYLAGEGYESYGVEGLGEFEEEFVDV